MAKIKIVKFNGYYGDNVYTVCKENWYSKKYMSKNTGNWISSKTWVKYWCMVSKEDAIKMWEKATGTKWCYGY